MTRRENRHQGTMASTAGMITVIWVAEPIKLHRLWIASNAHPLFQKAPSAQFLPGAVLSRPGGSQK